MCRCLGNLLVVREELDVDNDVDVYIPEEPQVGYHRSFG